jgi:methyl-accepting chemotaxis protein
MFDNWTFGRKVGLGFAIGIIALVVVGATGYRATQQLIANTGLVSHTHQVRRALAELEYDIVASESGQRGYVLTGKDEFLEPYSTGLAAMAKAYDAVRGLTIDNSAQQTRLALLKQKIDQKLTEMKLVLELRKTGVDKAIARIGDGDGRALMDDIRRLVDESDAAEVALLDVRAREADDSQAFATAVIVWGSLAAIVLTLIAAFVIARSLTNQVSTAVRHVQSSSTELQAAANQQASASKEQATAMSEIATTINELLATSRQIADSAIRVSQIAGQTATSARTGDTTVGKGSDAIAVVRRQVDLIVTHMLELGKKSQQVGSVLDIVAELAEQTNILAINATIEAAGAGDSGRRFGVVADEIRKLADRVAASTKEIRGMVDDVRGAVNTTVMATEAGSKAVDAGAMQVLEMAAAFRQISSLVGTTTDAAREIELSTKQQATAVEQVNVAIGNVSQATRETETSAQQTLQTSMQLATLSTKLVAIVAREGTRVR